jgi:hypothetical protein
MHKILFVIAAALMGLLSAESVHAEGLDPKERPRIARLLPQARVSLQEALAISAGEGRPIAAGFEIDKGKLNLWIFVRKGKRLLEVTWTTTAVSRCRRTDHEKDDLRDANITQTPARIRALPTICNGMTGSLNKVQLVNSITIYATAVIGKALLKGSWVKTSARPAAKLSRTLYNVDRYALEGSLDFAEHPQHLAAN